MNQPDREREQIAEATLVLRCQMRDEIAFERLVAEHAGKVKYYMRRLMARQEEADDALQRVWLAVWTQLPKLRSPSAFRPWLYRIARNIALQTLRGKVIEVPFEDDVAAPEAEDESFGPEEAAAVHGALQKLNLCHREVLVLYFLENMTYEEIAGVAGCSVGTVRSRMHYGKKALRRIIMEGLNDA